MALGDQELVRAVLDDVESAPIGERLRATLRMLATLTLMPNEFSEKDLAPMRTAGVSDEAIADAISVCALFNIIDRVADALGFDVPKDFAPGGRHPLLDFGYLQMVGKGCWSADPSLGRAQIRNQKDQCPGD